MLKYLVTSNEMVLFFQCFSCTTYTEWRDLLQRFQTMTEIAKKQNLFEVCTQRQEEWNPSCYGDFTDEAIALGKI